MLDSLISFFTVYGYVAVFGVLLLCGLGLPIPEDITLVAGGIISSVACSAEGSFFTAIKSCHEVHVMFAVSMLGVLIGDGIMFTLGHVYGEKVLRMKYIAKIVTPQRYAWIQQHFVKYGIWLVFAARFMPGLRSPIFIFSGTTRKISYFKFFVTDGLAALISVPLWVYLGFWGERQLSDTGLLEGYVKRGQMSIIIFFLSLAAIIALLWYFKRKFKAK